MRKLKILIVGLFMLTFVGAFAQTNEIVGKVTDATGSPIPGATIKVKGSKGGTSAGADGVFKLKAPANAVLIISGIGFENKEVKTAGMSTVSVQLSQDSRSLNEVVVTGVGVATSKKHLGIDVSSVSASQLPATPTASIDQALIGKIAGAQISSISGNPGDPVNILLRGINSIQGGTQPLIMLDGIQVRTTDINSLDLSNIERVEVVQGAASSALYGAQGANGVIQLFSKKGRKGPTAINFSTSYASNSYINSGHVNKASLHPYLTDANNNIVDANGLPDTVNSAGVIPYVAYQYGGAARSPIYNDPQNINDKPYNANLKWYDHFKQVFQTGYTLNNNINFSGASDKADYAFGVSNNHTLSPVMQNGYVDRTNLTANVGLELFKGFKIRSITQLIYTKNTLVPGLGGPQYGGYGYGNQPGSVGGVFSWLNTPAFYSLNAKLADGTYPAKQVSGNYLGANAFNPFYTQEYVHGLDNRVDIVQDLAAEYRVNKFVNLDAKYGINYRNEGDQVTYLNQSENLNSIYFGGTTYSGNYAPDNTGEIDKYQYNNTFQEFTANAYIKTDFERDFHSKLPISTNTQIGWDYRKTKYFEYDTYGLGLPLAPPINVGATSAQGVMEDYVEPFITFGYLVNQSIDYGDLAGVSGGFRSDYSSAFGEGSKPFTFPHVNAWFAPSSLKFWQDGVGNTLTFFKLRAAYGQAGIQPGAFQRIPVLNQGDIGQNLVYSIPGTSNNANLGVEVSTAKEAGADLTIAANKSGSWLTQITLSGTIWKNESDHVIYTVPVAPSLGSTGLLTNAITLRSNGVQFQLQMPLYKSKNLSWDFTTNFGHQISTLDNIVGTNEILVTSAGGSAQVLIPGSKIGQLAGYKAMTSLNQVDPQGSGETYSTEGGFEIVDGRVVNTASKQIQFATTAGPIGDGNPKFTASFINGFNYKGIVTFAFQFDWIYGSHLYNQTKEWMYRDGIHDDFDNKVTIGGQTAAFTTYHASAYYNDGTGNGNDAVRDYFYESSSFLRLRNLSLGFDVAKIAKVKVLKKCQLIFTGRNLFTKTKYTGMDPEISSGTPNSAWDRSVDNSTIPNLKSYQIGLNVGF